MPHAKLIYDTFECQVKKMYITTVFRNNAGETLYKKRFVFVNLLLLVICRRASYQVLPNWRQLHCHEMHLPHTLWVDLPSSVLHL